MVEKNDLDKAKYLLLRRLCKASAHSVQLIVYLKKKGFSEAVISEAIGIVRTFGFIDDVAYVARFVSALQNRGKSTKEILARSYQKNIPMHQIKAALSEENNEGKEEEVLRQLIEKKYEFLLDPEIDFKKRQKGLSALYRKGFNTSVIQKVLSLHFS